MTDTKRASDCIERDLSARRESFVALWLAPLALAGLITVIPPDSTWVAPAAWGAAFAWMGAACLVNARRCGRVHCYFSGPILLIGAVLAAALAVRVIDFGPNDLTAIVAATLGLAALTYGLEWVWGRYRR